MKILLLNGPVFEDRDSSIPPLLVVVIWPWVVLLKGCILL